MSEQILLLDRVEFSTVKIEENPGEFYQDKSFPQLATEFEDVVVQTHSDLIYPPDQLEDPRVFMLTYGLRVVREKLKRAEIPYDIEVMAVGYFRYVGGDEFKEEHRFRAVRFSGYQILYGAIREMVSNITARGRHGLWHLPARNFGGIAEAKANEDEAQRKQALADRSALALEVPKKRIKKSAAKLPE